jgi:hypothetical protein
MHTADELIDHKPGKLPLASGLAIDEGADQA